LTFLSQPNETGTSGWAERFLLILLFSEIINGISERMNEYISRKSYEGCSRTWKL